MDMERINIAFMYLEGADNELHYWEDTDELSTKSLLTLQRLGRVAANVAKECHDIIATYRIRELDRTKE